MDDKGAVKLTPRAKALFEKGEGQVRGYVPVAKPGGEVDLLHWSQAPRVTPKNALPDPFDGSRSQWNPKVIQQNIPVPQHVQERMAAGIPKQVTRAPSERYQILVKQLVDECRKSKKLHGRVIFPKSIEEEIHKLGWLAGVPNLRSRIENLEIDAIESYADWLTLRAAGQQRRKDYKRTVTDHPGHYSA